MSGEELNIDELLNETTPIWLKQKSKVSGGDNDRLLGKFDIQDSSLNRNDNVVKQKIINDRIEDDHDDDDQVYTGDRQKQSSLPFKDVLSLEDLSVKQQQQKQSGPTLTSNKKQDYGQSRDLNQIKSLQDVLQQLQILQKNQEIMQQALDDHQQEYRSHFEQNSRQQQQLLRSELKISGEAFRDQIVSLVGQMMQNAIEGDIQRYISDSESQTQEYITSSMKSASAGIISQLVPKFDQVYKNVGVVNESVGGLSRNVKEQLGDLQLLRIQFEDEYKVQQQDFQEAKSKLNADRIEFEANRSKIQKDLDSMQKNVKIECDKERQNWIYEKVQLKKELNEMRSNQVEAKSSLNDIQSKLEQMQFEQSSLESKIQQSKSTLKQLKDREHNAEQVYKDALRTKKEVNEMINQAEQLRLEAIEMKRVAAQERLQLQEERARFEQIKSLFLQQQQQQQQESQKQQFIGKENVMVQADYKKSDIDMSWLNGDQQEWPWRKSMQQRRAASAIPPQN
ncbi:hypothetical protein MIR68_003624 [Amoeboaphelidium protococcarum]|nr:hypothetical protein MIR68_003624 [Amoeboaphelidium protococcarum]